MGIKLDWEIETEHELHRDLSEHPLDRQARHANRRRAIMAVFIVAGLIVGVIGLVLWRLHYVDSTIEQQLRDTVSAEATALRLGDVAAFLTVQRSESEAWMLGQTDQFWAYQEIKQAHEVELTGEVLNLNIDRSRAYALVEEIIDGERYQRLWFYWRYEDGWRHVPMDVTFWGGDAVYEGENFTIAYGELDQPVVDALVEPLARLWGEGCRWLACAMPLPELTVRILPEAVVGVSWSPDQPDTLRIASPLTSRSRVDVPLEPDRAREIGALLAERLVNHVAGGLEPVPSADAAFLSDALERWLVGRFLGDGGTLGSSFVQSLVDAYGEQAVGMLARALTPEASIAVLGEIYNRPLETLTVDWREFFQWRLALEPFLLARGDQAGLLSLYDDLAINDALTLIESPDAASTPVPQVLSVQLGAGTDGEPRAWVVVRFPDGSEGPVTFRLVDGVWKRSTPDSAFDTLNANGS